MRLNNLRKLNPCEDGLAYAESQPSMQAAWDNCERGDWMLWLLGKLSGPVGSPSRKKLVLAACACARLSLEFVPKGEDRPRLAIDAAEDYARGGWTTLVQVRAAAYAAAGAAYAATTYAVDAAAAAAAAAAGAAYAYAATTYAATTYAVDAAAAAAAADATDATAWKQTLKQCADLVRGFYPKAPTLWAR